MECASSPEFVDAEFRTPDGDFDLALSVYDIDDASDTITRTGAEHFATANLDPPRDSLGADLSGIRQHPPVPSPGSECFKYLDDVHREIRLNDSSELVQLAATVLAEAEARKRQCIGRSVKEYVRQLIRDDDPEWKEFFKTAPNGQRWYDWAAPKA